MLPSESALERLQFLLMLVPSQNTCRHTCCLRVASVTQGQVVSARRSLKQTENVYTSTQVRVGDYHGVVY